MTRRLFGTMARVVFAAGLLAALVGCSYVYEVRFHVGIPVGTTAPLQLEVVGAYGVEERLVVMPNPTQTLATGVVSVCCAPDPLVTLQAYLDLNNNAAHDPGEPIDVWPGGPVRLTGNRSVQLRIPTLPAAVPSVGVPTIATP